MAAVHEHCSMTGKPAATPSGDFGCTWTIWDAAMKAIYASTPLTDKERMNYERNTPIP
jgi:hypothetical protein